MVTRIQLYRSSSTKFAFIFSTLLILALVLLCIEIYSVSHGEMVRPIYTKFVLALVIFICAGLFAMSFYVTKRINVITATADRIITTRDLTQRIPIDNSWHDLGKLAGALNTMLEEIEQSVSGMRQVTDNIAHDLRTPLTRLRNHIETLRDDTRSAKCPEQQEQFSGLVEECDALLSTFNALLRIANIESGRRHSEMHTLDLAALAQDVIELYEPVAAESEITLIFHAQPTYAIGEKDLLFQAIANLLDNAIKHTPAKGQINIDVASYNGKARLIIGDTGCGVSDEHKPYVFRRFYRIAACRSTPGSGLGLSLVQAIIRLHKGSISLSDRMPSGLIVTVTL